MNGKARFTTNLKQENLKAIQNLSLNNGHKRNEVIDDALELYLEKSLTRITFWLSQSYVTFLDEYSERSLEEIIREPLAVEVKAAFSNGKIEEKEAKKIVQALGFSLWEL